MTRNMGPGNLANGTSEGLRSRALPRATVVFALAFGLASGTSAVAAPLPDSPASARRAGAVDRPGPGLAFMQAGKPPENPFDEGKTDEGAESAPAEGETAETPSPPAPPATTPP